VAVYVEGKTVPLILVNAVENDKWALRLGLSRRIQDGRFSGLILFGWHSTGAIRIDSLRVGDHSECPFLVVWAVIASYRLARERTAGSGPTAAEKVDE
jgi:hypothetical protein